MGDSDMEILAKWMIRHGYATGHGDTMEDLLEELEWQITERSQRAVEVERERIAKQFDSGVVNVRASGQNKPDTVSPAEHKRRTNAPWNDKASY